MKTVITFSLVCAASIAAVTNLAAGVPDAWRTVSDFTNTPLTRVNALARDTAGHIFMADCGRDSAGRLHARIRKRLEPGGSWSLIEDFLYPGSSTTEVRALGLDKVGNLYAVGTASGDGKNARWLVRKSADGGVTWSTADDFVHPAGDFSCAEGFASDSTGNLYVVGSAEERGAKDNPAPRSHWLVRSSADRGKSWSTVDDFTTAFGAKAVAIVSTARGVFVAGAGYVEPNWSGRRWLVRHGTDQGPGMMNWQTVDDFQEEQGCGANAQGLAADSAGNLYVVGCGWGNTGQGLEAHWLVRRATCKGTDWKAVDQFQLAPSGYTTACAVASDDKGAVYVIGLAAGPNTGLHWIVRKTAGDATGSCTIGDDFQLPVPPTRLVQAAVLVNNADDAGTRTPPNEYLRGSALLCGSGSIYAAGWAVSGGVEHGLLRSATP